MQKHQFLFLLMISIGLFFFYGCGDDDTVTGGDINAGSLGDHSDSPNEKVTIENAEDVTMRINTMTFRASNEGKNQLLSKPVINITIDINSEVPGYESGKALVEGKIIQKMDNLIIYGYDFDYTCTFYDFSDDGELFLGGSVYNKGSLKFDTDNTSDYSIIMRGGIRFKGKYEGTEEFTTTVRMDNEGNFTFEGMATVTSDGKTFTQSISY